MINLKRAYESPSRGDGYRILVERLWPRGVSKEKGRIDLWQKEVAPSAPLRTWYSHDVKKWPEFRKRYLAELKANPAVKELKGILSEKKAVTFVYAARDELHNSAVVLREYLSRK